MEIKLSGRVLFVFSDPGGAKPCLSLMSDYLQDNTIAISDRVYSFYDDFRVNVLILHDGYEQIIADFKPDLIFTGTSYTSEIEQKFIALAKKARICCHSFVDHWTSVSSRFTDKDNSFNFPDQIWVLDHRAKEIAISEGINPDLIYISGNPYHNWLRKWKPNRTHTEFTAAYGIDRKIQKLVVFSPDPLSNIDGMKIYGFDEISASSQLLDVLEKYKTNGAFENCQVLIKMHPNQQEKRISEIFSGNSFYKILPGDVNTNEVIFFANVIIGFFSSILLEADIMKKPIIRFLPVNLKNDPFFGLNIGVAANKESLANEILHVLSNHE